MNDETVSGGRNGALPLPPDTALRGADDDGEPPLAIVTEASSPSATKMLVSLARVIAAHDLDEALQNVVNTAHDLTQADVVYLTVTAPTESRFVVKAAVGTGSDSFNGVNGSTEIGIAGYVKRTRQSHWVSDYLNASEIVHAEEVDGPMRNEGIVSMLGIPLLADNRFLGTLNIADRRRRRYSAEEVTLLEAFGTLAAIALDAARLRQENTAALATLQQAYTTIENAILRHDALSRLVLTEGDVGRVAEWLARELRCRVTVTVTDRSGYGQELHSPSEVSTGHQDTRRHAPAAYSRLVDASAANGRCVVSHDEDGTTVHTVALVAEGAVRGAFILERDIPLDATEVRTLEHAAHVATLLTLAQNAVADAEARVRRDLLSQVLDGEFPYPRAVVIRAKAQGVDLEACNVLAVLATSPPVTDRAARLLSDYARRNGGLAGMDRGHPTVLLPAENADEASAAIHAYVHKALVTEEIIVCSTPVEGSAAFDHLVMLARRGTALMAALGITDGAAPSTLLAPFMVLLDPRRTSELDSFVQTTLGPILAYDKRRQTRLAETLASYYICAENLTRTAERLHIHINTLQKRLDRVGELLGPDWRDPDRSLSQNLASRLVILKRELIARYGQSANKDPD